MKRSLLLILAIVVIAGLPLYAVGTPAGTQIKNQATAQYLDENGNSQSSTSNEVITIVQPIYGLTVSPDGTTGAPSLQTATAGTRVYFPYTLTNTGNASDNFNVATAVDGSNTFTPANVKIYLDSNGDGVVGAGDNEITNTGAIIADAIVHLIVAYDVPATATAGQFALVNLTATSANDGTKTDTNNWNRTTVVADAVMTISKQATAAATVYPGSSISYVISGSNTGSAATTALSFTNIDTSGDGLEDAVSGILVEDPLPDGISVTGTPGTDFVYVAPAGAIKLYGYSNGKWSTAGNLGGWGGTAAITKIGMYISGSLAAGQGYELDWTGTVKATAAVGMLSNKAYIHWADVSASDKNTGSNTTQTMVNATFAVKIGPYNTPEGAGDPGDVTTKSNQLPGATLVYTNTVKNNGTDNDVFNITTAWTANQVAGAAVSLFMADGLTPLGDANSDGIPDTGTVLKNGGTVDIVVKIQIPTSAASDILVHDLTVTAKSTKDATKTDTTIDRIDKIVAGSTNLTNNNAHGETAYGIAGTPGSTITFPLKVTNNNGYAETYSLDQNMALATGWSVLFYPDTDGDGVADAGSSPISSTPNIASLGEYKFVAVVSIPSGATPISGDPWAAGTSQKLEFQATGALSGQTDTQRVWAEVSSVYSFTFEPDNSGISTPAGTVFYTHVIKNTGNALQTFSVALDSSPRTGWIYTFSTNGTTFSNTLSGVNVAAGAQQTIYVKVYVPSSEAVGAVDTGIVKVTNDHAVSLSRQDTTTIVGGNLKMTKSVTSYNAADTATLNQPGDELEYSVAYQNLAAKQLTQMYIYDTIPLYTGFKVASATGGTAIAYSSDNGATWVYTPVSGGGSAPAGYDYAVTNIRWTVGALDGGATGTVTFRVRIK
jgi:hypothetical protein